MKTTAGLSWDSKWMYFINIESIANTLTVAAAAANGRCWFGFDIDKIFWFITINQSNWSDEVHNSLHTPLHSICFAYTHTVYRLNFPLSIYQNMTTPDINIWFNILNWCTALLKNVPTLILIWHERERKMTNYQRRRKKNCEYW